MLEKFLNNEGTVRLTIEEQKSIDGTYPELDCHGSVAEKEYAC